MCRGLGVAVRRRVAIAVLCGLVSGAASAQVGSGQITGVVTDPGGRRVPGASVVAISDVNAATRQSVSSSSGVYGLVGLLPGVYRVAIELDGFKPVVREGIRVETGQTIRLDFALTVGTLRETVTVTTETPVLRASTASLGEVVSQEKVAALPLNGRAFVTLAALAPGVALPQGSLLPRINGGRPRTNEYLFDGISVLQPEPGQVAYFPVVDAIQEFKIETNSPPAEFGRFNGGVVNLTTKAGTNALHGTGFEFLRHEALNARNFFQAGSPVKPEFRRHQFGGVLGGPIAVNRTFFFADYQGQRQTIARTQISNVPTLLQRQGIFTEAIGGRVATIYDPATTTGSGASITRTPFQGNAIPIGRMDPVALALLQRYPLPTSGGTANNYRRTDNEIDDQDQFDIRLDHRLVSDQIFARLTFFSDRFTPVTPLPDGSGNLTTGTLGPQNTRVWAFASNYQRVLSARWLNEVRVGDTRRSVQRSAATLTGTAASSLGLPGIPSTSQFADTLPTFQIGGVQQLGSPTNTASDFSTGVSEIADSLTFMSGRHSVKVGADLRWERLNVIQPPSPQGLFVFSTLGSDLPNVANTGMSPEQVLGEEVDGRADLYSVGVLWYRLVSGTLPFEADSALAMLQRQIRDEPISLHLQRPELPDWCDQIVQRALKKAPADRFQSAEEFRDALARATGPLPVADLAKTFAASIPSSPGPTDTIDLSRADALVEPEAQVVPARRKRQGGFAMAYSLVTVLTIAVAFAGYVIVRGADREATVEAPAPPPSPTRPAPEALPAKEVVDLPAPEPVVENSETASAPVKTRIEKTAPPEARAITPAPRHVEAAPRSEPTIAEHAATTPAVVVDAALTFETRVLLGTKKPKEYSARLLFGEGRITVVANDETASRLYEIPYGRVVSISYSHGRDPMCV